MYLNTILSYSLVIFLPFPFFFLIPPFHWISTFSPFLLPVPLLPSFLVLKFLNCTSFENDDSYIFYTNNFNIILIILPEYFQSLKFFSLFILNIKAP